MYENTCSQLEKDKDFVSTASPSYQSKKEKEKFLRAGVLSQLIFRLRKSNDLAKKPQMASFPFLLLLFPLLLFLLLRLNKKKSS